MQPSSESPVVTVRESKIEKVPIGIPGEKLSKDMASSRNLVFQYFKCYMFATLMSL